MDPSDRARRLTAAATLAATLSAGFVACGRAPEPTQRAQVSYGVWRDAIVAARLEAPCEDTWECPRTREGARGTTWRAPDVVACARDTPAAAGLRRQLGALEEAIDAGEVAFDAFQAAECVVALEDQRAWARCQGLEVKEPRACRASLAGRLGVGAACTLDAQCASGSRCLAADEDVCIRTCQAVCEGASCAQDCGSSAPPIECYAVERLGAPCASSSECGAAPWMRCAPQTSRCVRARSLGVGEACSSALECEVDAACDEGVCRARAALPLAGDGDRCALSPGSGDVCAPGSACQGVEFTGSRQGACAPPGALGAPCGVFTQCALGLYCEGASFGARGVELGECVGGQADGEACSTGVECASGRCDTRLEVCSRRACAPAL